LLKPLRSEGGDGDRDVLSLFLATLGRHDDLAQRRGIGRGRRRFLCRGFGSEAQPG
jgi:hypothetical protein